MNVALNLQHSAQLQQSGRRQEEEQEQREGEAGRRGRHLRGHRVDAGRGHEGQRESILFGVFSVHGPTVT